jgi:predicted aspartyl protease
MTAVLRGVRRWLIAGLPLALVLLGCTPSPGARPEVPAAAVRVVSASPPPFRERTLTTFARAASALDWERAEALAVTATQREYAAVLRLLRDRRLDEVDAPLSRLAKSRDKDVAAKARALRAGLLMGETPPAPLPAGTPDEQAFIQALSHAQAAQRWSSSTGAVRQPLRIRSGDVVFADVAINGMPARLMLDTGADLTIIGSRLAERLGVRVLPGRAKVKGALGDTAEVRLAAVDFEIGGARVENHPVGVVESSHLERLRHVLMLPGVIGWNTIRGLRITVDRDASTLDIERTRAFAGALASFFWIGKPLIRVQSENGLPMHFVLDTGAAQSYIARGLAAEAGLGEGRVGPIMIYAFGGERTVQGAVHDDAVLYVGGARLVLRTFQSRPPVTRPYGPEDGMLGADALAHGRIVIDFASGEFSIASSRPVR